MGLCGPKQVPVRASPGCLSVAVLESGRGVSGLEGGVSLYIVCGPGRKWGEEADRGQGEVHSLVRGGEWSREGRVQQMAQHPRCALRTRSNAKTAHVLFPGRLPEKKFPNDKRHLRIIIASEK